MIVTKEPLGRHLVRWVTFNAVGLAGVGVQLGSLVALTEWLGLHYLVSTGVAIEAAIVHNFVWHACWTWRDRSDRRVRGCWTRFGRFNLLNGVVSIGGQLLFTGVYAWTLGVHYMAANLLAIATCSLVSFVVNDRVVFRNGEAAERHPVRARDGDEEDRAERAPSGSMRTAALCALLLGATFSSTAEAAELTPRTVSAWTDYVAATERRIRAEQSSEQGFLVLDFQEHAAKARARLRRGDTLVSRMETRDADDAALDIPNGEVHHWRGSIFVPSATVDDVLRELGRPLARRDFPEEVLESRVLEREGRRSRVYLKLRRTKIVTVHYNTEHEVEYTRHGDRHASSRSIATRIAELDDAETHRETEKPIGNDQGFLWRLNAYWRYEEIDGGVIIECESISLSRSVPSGFRWMVAPLIERAARESMERTLTAMRTRLRLRHEGEEPSRVVDQDLTDRLFRDAGKPQLGNELHEH